MWNFTFNHCVRNSHSDNVTEFQYQHMKYTNSFLFPINLTQTKTKHTHTPQNKTLKHILYNSGDNCWIDEVTEADQHFLIHMA